MNKRPGGALSGNSKDFSKSQLFPILSKWRELGKKAAFWPMVLTVIWFVLLEITWNQQSIGKDINGKIFIVQLSGVLRLVGFYLYGGVFYLTYRLCGKRKAWWVLLAAAVLMAVIFLTPIGQPYFWIFRKLLPGDVPDPDTWSQVSFLSLLPKIFFGAGLMEELMKATPVFLALWIGNRFKSPMRERIGVTEPLDGILLAAASASVFAFFETMLQYVPRQLVQDLSYSIDQGIVNGEHLHLFHATIGLNTLILRGLGNAFGHIAYSGYFGYFIGLSVLRPSKRWQILGIGYLSAAILHTMWDASSGIFLQVAIGGISYAFLAAAILKARDLSPNPQNLRTSILRAFVPKPAVEPIEVQQPAAAPDPKPSPSPVAVTTPAGAYLILGSSRIPLLLYARLTERQVPGLKAAADGWVAQVNANPHDLKVLGLQNRSTVPWKITDTSGETRELQPGRSFALATGTTIDMAGQEAKIEIVPEVVKPRITVPRERIASIIPDGPIELLLVIKSHIYDLSLGTRLNEAQIPGLKAQANDGIVAEVNQNPNDPSLLGLKNLSSTTWTTMDAAKELREIASGRSLALTRGTKIDFGSESGAIA